jgi:hypothetical protein
VVKAVAFDSVPPNRRRIYEHLQAVAPAWASTSTVGTAVRLPTLTARRALEELVAYDLVEKDAQGPGKPDLWRAV